MSIQAKAAFVLTIATFLCKGINFFSIPIFTRLLSTQEMGIVTTYNSWYVLIVVFANLALDSGSFNIAMMEFDKDRYGYMSSILFLSTVASAIIGMIFITFQDSILPVMGMDTALMWLMIISFIFLPATSFWMLYQRYIYQYKNVAVITLLSTGFSLIFSTFITYWASENTSYNLADVRLISTNIILLAWGLFFYIFISIKGHVRYNRVYWSFVLTINTPLMVHALAKNVLDVSDRTMIASMVGQSEVGIYGVVYSISAIALIIWNAINSSLIPYTFDKLQKNDGKDISLLTEKMLIVYSVACISLTLIAPELVKFLATREYYEAIYLVPPIAAGIFFTALYNIYSNILLFYKKTNYIMLATIVAAIFNIITNYIFISIFGYQAAAYTTLCSYALLAMMQYLQLKRVKGYINIFNNRKLWLIAIITTTICIMINVLYTYNYVRSLLIVILCIGGIFFRKKIIEFVSKLINKKVS